MRVTNSTVSNNKTGSGTSSGDAGGAGGGLFNNKGTATVSNTTIFSNTTGKAGDNKNAGVNGGNGGGIYNNDGLLTIDSSTISGNTASDGADGGGIYNTGTITKPGLITITNSSIVGNTANEDGGGIYNDADDAETKSTITMKNTLVAGNKATDTASGHDINGTIVSQDYNLVQATTGANISGSTTNNKTGVDPKVSPIASNGGKTQTHALQSGSPAIDAGNCSGAKTDQRGFGRPVDTAGVTNVSDGCDIGAYEFGATSSASIYLPMIIK